jgi:hypothetical protein
MAMARDGRTLATLNNSMLRCCPLRSGYIVSILQLREKMTDAAKIPISVKFAKQVNLIDEGENPHQTTSSPKQENPAKPVVSFSISEEF